MISNDFTSNENAPPLTHLPRICHSRFCHTAHEIADELTDRRKDRQTERRKDGNTGPILLVRPLTREVKAGFQGNKL